MQPAHRSPAPLHLAFVAACLLLAAYLPTWYKLWFVAESGHYGGGTVWEWLLLLGLYRRWRPALALTYAYLLLQLLVAGYILPHNITAGGPLLGFVLTGSLQLAGLLTLYNSSAIQRYLEASLPAPLAE
ncbi:hypothetical protein GO988_12170 [Hymenobacter sp. HMF4947]|uniref:Uncharacterized protein n=1 Tax=Hymenobacter ginkgonis TaxID=2682976 RepID=A0A7K1TF93_9BACT|nr:hypothetical protein [Hymenobacter ginkgonis]MVN77083.1 hypothetical protein [Hymenobacter ginkgonis]